MHPIQPACMWSGACPSHAEAPQTMTTAQQPPDPGFDMITGLWTDETATQSEDRVSLLASQ
jgi:hypothetical protein